RRSPPRRPAPRLLHLAPPLPRAAPRTIEMTWRPRLRTSARDPAPAAGCRALVRRLARSPRRRARVTTREAARAYRRWGGGCALGAVCRARRGRRTRLESEDSSPCPRVSAKAKVAGDRGGKREAHRRSP